MISDAKEVWHSADDLASANNNVELADDVKVVKEGTHFDFSADGKTITIENCPISVAKGEKFAVYVDGLPTVYEAASVSTSGKSTVIKVKEVDDSESYKKLTYGSNDEFDLADFEESSGVSTQVYPTIDDAAKAGVETGGISVQSLSTQGISYKNGTLSYSAKSGAASVTGAIAGMKLKKSVDLAKKRYYVSVSGTTSLTASVRGSVDVSVPLGRVWCAGCSSEFKVVAQASGSLSKTISANFEVGAQYDPKIGFRMVKTFKKGKPGITATAQARVGYELSATIGCPGISATVGAELGFEANYETTKYTSGKPSVCQDLECHVYAGAYVSSKFGIKPLTVSYSKRFTVWNANNSPTRMHKHIEDGKTVSSCARGKKYTYGWWRTGSNGSKWGNLMSGSAGSGSEYGYNSAGEWVEYATYEYRLDSDKKAIITKYHGNTRALVIPDTLDGHSVVGIDGEAFANNAYLASVVFPSGLKEIGDGAFEGCTALSSVDLPSGLKELGYKAFGGCDALASVVVPASLEKCDYGWNDGCHGPFGDCGSLSEVRFSKGAKRVPSGLLAGCPGVTSVVVPEGVTSVDAYAFCDAKSLSSVSLPSTLVKVSKGAFEGCTALASVKLPDAVTEVGDGAFEGCTALSSVALSTSLSVISSNAFKGCSSLSSVKLPASITEIESSAFASCEALTFVDLPTGLKELGVGAFSGCESLSSVKLPASVVIVPGRAFEGCSTLASVEFPSGLKEIRYDAFRGTALESVVLPYKVSKIGSSAFAECTKLKSILIPKSVTSISDDAFSYPSRMTVTGAKGSVAETWAKDHGATFVVNTKAVSNVSLSETSVKMLKGRSLTLKADIQPADFGGDVVWKSSNTNVVTVDSEGNLEAKGVGKASVKLIVGEKVATCEVTVVQPMTSLWLDESSYSMEAGEKIKLTAHVYPSDADSKTLKWSSSDEAVAKVDQSGNVTAFKKGEATITVEAQDGSKCKDTCDITVTNSIIVTTSVNQLESTHPYANDFSDIWEYTIKGAPKVELSFDKRTSVEEDSDFIRIYDKNGKEVSSWTGTELAGKTVTVPGDTVRIRLETDGSVTDWGFKVTSAKAADSNKPSAGQQKSIASASISGITEKKYNGSAHKQNLVVRLGSKTLNPGTDYVVTYKNNVKVGTATVLIEGKGEYTGTKTASFKIGKAGQPMQVKTVSKKVKYSKVKKKAMGVSGAIAVSRNQGAVSFKNVSTQKKAKKLKVNASRGTITVPKKTKKGTYQVKVRVAAKGNANYLGGSKTVTVKIVVK